MADVVRSLLSRVDVSDRNGQRGLRWWTYLVYLFLYAPVAIVIVLSFTPREVPSFPMPGFSLQWYEMILLPPFADATMIQALWTSLKVGVISAVGAGVIGTFAALGMTRNEFRSRLLSNDVLNTVFLAPLVVPWIVTGISVLVLYNLIGIAGSFLSLIVGHVLIAVPFVVLVVATQLYNFDESLEEAAKNLGAGPVQTFYEVTLPLIAPGIIAGMMFAFTISFDNFTQTFFWAGSDTQTLPIVIYSKIRFGIDPSVNAIGTIIVMISLSVALLAEKLSSRIVE
jgi:spermidine/putrescine transport system permease protein